MIICIMGKSGTGKSTLINGLVDKDSVYHSVKSFTTRKMRENDVNDALTHTFVNRAFWEKRKDKALEVYHNTKLDYYNWVDDSCFKEDKINLFAIDPIAFADLEKKRPNVYGIYLTLSEDERKKRIESRGSVYFRNEKELEIENILNANNWSQHNVESSVQSNLEYLDWFIKKIVEEKRGDKSGV